jgi:hypothetical protein
MLTCLLQDNGSVIQRRDALVSSGRHDPFLFFLGGSFAAAVLAECAAVDVAQGRSGKPAAAPGTPEPARLVTEDQGATDLGAFHHLPFNALTLVLVVVTFPGDLRTGLPPIPSVLTGLALTSAGSYSATQLLYQQASTLNSPAPTSVRLDGDVELCGVNLVVPDGGRELPAARW